MKNRPIIYVQAVLAACDVIAVSSSLGDILPAKIALVFVLLTKAVGVGVAFVVQASTVPLQDSAAYVNSEGRLVAGPAAGVTNGEGVKVVEAPSYGAP